jgi:hypothetical protein
MNTDQVGPVGDPVVESEHGIDLLPGGVEVACAGVEPGRDRVRVSGRTDPPPHRLGRHVTQLGGVVAGSDYL